MRLKQKQYRIGSSNRITAIDFGAATRQARLTSTTKLDNHILTGANARTIWDDMPDLIACDLYIHMNPSKHRFNEDAKHWFLRYTFLGDDAWQLT